MRTCQDYEDDLDSAESHRKDISSKFEFFQGSNMIVSNLTIFNWELLVTEELMMNNFHAAKRKIEKHFIDKAVSNFDRIFRANCHFTTGKIFFYTLVAFRCIEKYHPAVNDMIVPVLKINLVKAFANSLLKRSKPCMAPDIE
jgi:hypothetical protein